jgi:hypothetical protein
VIKVHIHTRPVSTRSRYLESGAAIILADRGADSWQIGSDWFDAVGPFSLSS